MQWWLALDFGTSSTEAAESNGSVSLVEVAGQRRIPSAVFAPADGSALVVGVEAQRRGAREPQFLERCPKRRVGQPRFLLGERVVATPDAVAAVLESVSAEARRRHNGESPAGAVVTHPVRWGLPRQEVLVEAARRAGLAEPVLVPEPVAAAVWYVADSLESGAVVAVYDLGGGTFDCALLRRTGAGFELLGTPGGSDDIGGEDFDWRLYRLVGERLDESHPEVWEALRHSTERRWQRANAELLTEVHEAKETLSSHPTVDVYVGLADVEVRITRPEFEALIADDVARSADLLDDTIARAGIAPTDVAAFYLVGGSSRIPLVAATLQSRYGADRVRTWDDPQAVVALGAAKVATSDVATAAPPATSVADHHGPPETTDATPTAPLTVAAAAATAPLPTPDPDTAAPAGPAAPSPPAPRPEVAPVVASATDYGAPPAPQRAARSSSALPWIVSAGVSVAAIVGLIVLIVGMNGTDSDVASGTTVAPGAAPSATSAAPATAAPTTAAPTTTVRTATTAAPTTAPPTTAPPTTASPGSVPVRGRVARTCGADGRGDCFLTVRADRTPNSSALYTLNEGAAIDVLCQLPGSSVSSSVLGGSSDVWAAVASGGFVANVFVDAPGFDLFSVSVPCPAG